VLVVGWMANGAAFNNGDFSSLLRMLVLKAVPERLEAHTVGSDVVDVMAGVGQERWWKDVVCN
jgi:hypothetical protein